MSAVTSTTAIGAFSSIQVSANLPAFGQNPWETLPAQAECAPMPDQADLDELTAYLVRTTRLTPAEASRVVHEVMSFMNETPEAFIRRRHLALQSAGHSNSVIFSRIATELEQWRFRASGYSERQIRRIIYG